MTGEDRGQKGRLRVASLQLNCQQDVGENLATCARLIDEAAARGAELVLLPENFAFMGPESQKREVAERLGDLEAPIQRALSEWSRRHSIHLVAGGFPEQSGDPRRPFNTAAVLGPDGRQLATYRKIHLFDVKLPDGSELCESAANSAGSEPVVTEVGGFQIGLSICYDLRFPELYRALVDRGAEVLVVPAAFTLLTGKDHWHVLLRARAIEAQCFVIAAGQWGSHPKGRTTFGHSLVVDPWGTVIADCSDGVGFVVAEIDRARLERVRTNLPSLTHRKLG